MKETRCRTNDRALLASAEPHHTPAKPRLIVAAARRNEARWAVARTLPTTSDYLWHELNEAEYQYRRALKECGMDASRTAAERRN